MKGLLTIAVLALCVPVSGAEETKLGAGVTAEVDYRLTARRGTGIHDP